jgi:hypothetical protein
MDHPDKKHPCPDCRQCQWCSDERCGLCLRSPGGCRKKLSMSEQITLFEQLNRTGSPNNADGIQQELCEGQQD